MTTKLDLAMASGKRDIILILLETYHSQIVKQFYSDNILFTALKNAKNVIKQVGGNKIKQQLSLGNSENIGTFGRGDTKSPSYVDAMSECETPWRYYYAAILELFVDKQQASGGKATLNKLAKDIKDKTTGLQDLMNEHCYAGGSYSKGPMDGLQILIADNPLKASLPSQAGGVTANGKVCNIDQNSLTHSYWRNHALDFNGSNDYDDPYYGLTATAETVTGVTSGNTGYYAGKIGTSDLLVDPMGEMGWIAANDWHTTNGPTSNRGMENYLEDAMEWMAKSCSMGKSSLRNRTIIVCSKGIHSKFKKTQLSYVNASYTTTSFGFRSELDYEGIPIIWTPTCPDGHMYFINMDHLHMVIDPRYFFNYSDMVELPGSIKDKGMFIIAILNLILSRRNCHGVIYGLNSWEEDAAFTA